MCGYQYSAASMRLLLGNNDVFQVWEISRGGSPAISLTRLCLGTSVRHQCSCCIILFFARNHRATLYPIMCVRRMHISYLWSALTRPWFMDAPHCMHSGRSRAGGWYRTVRDAHAIRRSKPGALSVEFVDTLLAMLMLMLLLLNVYAMRTLSNHALPLFSPLH